MLPLFYKQDANNRKHQINTLKIFNDNVMEIVADTEYEIPFKSGGNQLSLKISLGHEFPKEKPTLSVNPLIYHPWVNENGIITSAPGLINFTIHSDLGRVVQAIIRDFQRNPPLLVANNNVISPNIPILDKRGNSNVHLSQSFSPPSNMLYNPKNNQNILFMDLKLLSLDELRFLNENEDRMLEFLDDLPSVKEHNKMLTDLIDSIEEVAEENLKQEEKVTALMEAVNSRIEDINKLSFNNEKLYTIYQSLAERYSPRNIQETLRQSAKGAEEASDKIAENFLNSDLDVENFLNMFIKTKSLCQLRKAKEEKLCQQLDRLEKAGF